MLGDVVQERQKTVEACGGVPKSGRARAQRANSQTTELSQRVCYFAKTICSARNHASASGIFPRHSDLFGHAWKYIKKSWHRDEWRWVG